MIRRECGSLARSRQQNGMPTQADKDMAEPSTIIIYSISTRCQGSIDHKITVSFCSDIKSRFHNWDSKLFMSIPTEPDEPTKAVDAPNLPPELWLIFRFDTSANTSTAAPYEPFQPCPDTAAARQVGARNKSFRTCERTKTPITSPSTSSGSKT